MTAKMMRMVGVPGCQLSGLVSVILEPNKLGSSPIVAAKKYFLQKCRFSHRRNASFAFSRPKICEFIISLHTIGNRRRRSASHNALQVQVQVQERLSQCITSGFNAKVRSITVCRLCSTGVNYLSFWRDCVWSSTAAAQSRPAALTIVFGKRATDQ